MRAHYAGLFSFLVNLMAAAWIKFSPTMVAPSATTGILGAALLYLGMTHSRWAQHIFQHQPVGHVRPSQHVGCGHTCTHRGCTWA